MQTDLERAKTILARAGHDWRESSGDHHLRLSAPEVVAAALVVDPGLADSLPAIVEREFSAPLLEAVWAAGVSLEVRDSAGNTALLRAAMRFPTWVEPLLQIGAQADVLDRNGVSALAYAVRTSNLLVVEALLRAGADPSLAGPTALPPTFWASTPDMLTRLLEAGADVHAVDPTTGDSLMVCYARNRNLPMLQVLVERGVEDRPNRSGWTGAAIASNLANPWPEGMALLAAATPGDSRLAYATDLATVTSLLAEGLPIDQRDDLGATLLHVACLDKDDHRAEFALEHGAKTDVVDAFGALPIQYALAGGLTALAPRLVPSSAPPVALRAALVEAIRTGQRSVADALLAAGASVDGTVSLSPVRAAAEVGDADMLERLLRAGASPDITGDSSSALLVASERGHVACVRLLVAAGADVTKTDPVGYDALRLAQVSAPTPERASEVAQVLLEGGAIPTVTLVTSEYEKNFEAVGAAVAADVDRREPADLTAAHVLALLACGERERVLKLLAEGLPLDRFLDEDAAALGAAIDEHPDVATAVIEAGLGAVAHPGRGAALYRVASENVAWLTRMLADGAPPNEPGFGSAFALAAAVGCEDPALRHSLVQVLFDAGADPDPLLGGWTPLMRAARVGDVRLMEDLLARGADPSRIGKIDGLTAHELLQREHPQAAPATAPAPDAKRALRAHLDAHRGDPAWKVIEGVRAPMLEAHLVDAPPSEVARVVKLFHGAAPIDYVRVPELYAVTHRPEVVGRTEIQDLLVELRAALMLHQELETFCEVARLVPNDDVVKAKVLADGTVGHARLAAGQDPSVQALDGAPELLRFTLATRLRELGVSWRPEPAGTTFPEVYRSGHGYWSDTDPLGELSAPAGLGWELASRAMFGGTTLRAKLWSWDEAPRSFELGSGGEVVDTVVDGERRILAPIAYDPDSQYYVAVDISGRSEAEDLYRIDHDGTEPSWFTTWSQFLDEGTRG